MIFTRLLLLILFCLIIGCSNPDHDAQQLLAEARSLVALAKKAEESNARSEALEQYNLAASKLVEIKQKYQGTLIEQGFSSGSLDLVGITSSELIGIKIPRLSMLLRAEEDPLFTALQYAVVIPDPIERATVLLEAREQFATRTDTSQVKNVERDLVSTINLIEDAATKAQLLADCIRILRDEGQKAMALNYAFRAKSAAKQIQVVEQRNAALIAIALQYFMLDVPQGALEALQSIPLKAGRIQCIKDIAKQLIAKDRSDDALQTMVLINDPEAHIETLLDIMNSDSQEVTIDTKAKFLKDAQKYLENVTESTRRYILQLLLVESGILVDSELSIKLLNDALSQSDYLGPEEAEILGRIGLLITKIHQQDLPITAAQLATELEGVLKKAKDSSSKDRALSSAAQLRMRLNQLSLAQTLASSAKSPEGKVMAALAISSELTDSASKTVYELLQTAEKSALLIPVATRRLELLLEIRKRWVSFGQLLDAERINNQYLKQEKKWRTYLKSYHQLLLQHDKHEESVLFARNVNDPYLKALLLADSARAISTSSMNQAISLMEEAIISSENGKDPVRSTALAGVFADTMLEMNWPKLAENLVDTHQFNDKAIWYVKIAGRYMFSNQTQEITTVLGKALTEAKKLSFPQDKAKVLTEISKLLSMHKMSLPETLRTQLNALIPPQVL